MVGLAQSDEGWMWYIKWVLWYIKWVLCPRIIDLEQEPFVTHTHDLCLILASPLCTTYLAQPLLTSLHHVFLFRPISNLSVERRPSHGATQLKPSLSWNAEDGGVSRGHYGRRASSNWQKWGSSIGYTLQIVVLSGDAGFLPCRPRAAAYLSLRLLMNLRTQCRNEGLRLKHTKYKTRIFILLKKKKRQKAQDTSFAHS